MGLEKRVLEIIEQNSKNVLKELAYTRQHVSSFTLRVKFDS